VGREGRDVALNAHEKDALRFQIVELVEADEPEAVVATLKRIAERMAMRAMRQDDRDGARRWDALAERLSRVLDPISRA
jgi:hypothetical protein